MKNLIQTVFFAAMFFFAIAAGATIFGSVHGLIHDPQHRPVQDAKATLTSTTSDWSQSAVSNIAGEFRFENVPLGEYRLTVGAPGFANAEQTIAITSGRDAKPHFSLTVARAAETVEVQDIAPAVNPESSTSTNIVNRETINHTPGADETNSLAMVTNYTPGAYMVHDQLHIRGGHQVSWLLDGVPVPNTSIASNVGPQFDPKDIDYLEVQRGGYNAEYGDRTYGVFNVVTRSGFERDRQGELVLSYGSYNATNPEISFGDHSERFAWYGSLSGYRTDLGLETPSSENLHNQAAGLGSFGSVIFSKSPNDQLRLVTSVRGDHYQVPNTPDLQTQGFRNVENERDAFLNFSWLHTAGTGVVLTVSPFYHFNRAHYIGDYTGVPDPSVFVPQDDRGSNYVGGVVAASYTRGQHNARAGLQVFGQRDNQLFAVNAGNGTPTVPPQREVLWGTVSAFFLEDQYKLTRWLTLNGGVRLTHFGGTGTNTLLGGNHPISENAADPRLGAALQIPKLHWVARSGGATTRRLPCLRFPDRFWRNAITGIAASCHCEASVTNSGNLGSRSRSPAGPSMSPTSAPQPGTTLTMMCWATRTFFSRSPSIGRASAAGKRLPTHLAWPGARSSTSRTHTNMQKGRERSLAASPTSRRRARVISFSIMISETPSVPAST